MTWYIFARYGGISTRVQDFNETVKNQFDKSGWWCSELSVRTYEMETGPWIWIFALQTVLQVHTTNWTFFHT